MVISVLLMLILWIIPGKSFSITSLGQMLGLIGFMLLTFNVILGSRLKYLEDYFYSQNKIYIVHHLIGGAGLVLLILHPVILSLRYLSISPGQALSFVALGTNINERFGVLALWLMIILLVITFFIKISYNKWYSTHKLFFLVYIFAGIHLLTIKSDVYINIPLRIYLTLFFIAGLLALVYRTIIPSLIINKFDYFVQDLKVIGDFIFLKLKARNKSLEAKLGQFVFLDVFGESHPFSVTNIGETLDLVIKASGDWTIKLKSLKANDKVKVEGAYGKFGQQTASGEEVWVAGGIGITPFIGLAKEINNKKVTLFYSVKNKSEFINKVEFEKMQTDRFKVVFIESDTQGRLTADKIISLDKSVKYLLCGPPAMVESLKQGLLKLNVDKNNIILEEFFLK